MTARAALEVVSAGPLTTVQDLGRPGLGRLAVTASGAYDRAALRLANRLVGNPEGAAGLECLLGGLAVRAVDAPVTVAVTGCRGALTVDDRAVDRGTPLTVAPGQVLVLGPAASGLRAYVAVRGGLSVPPVLGSRSRDTLAGLGPEPLTAGGRLPVGAAVGPVPAVDHVPVPAYGEPVPLAALPGPRWDWFTDGARALLGAATYEVSTRSDRVGIRLTGPALERVVTGELPSEPLVRGALQVPPDGTPVIMGPDHPTTGGYPVVAVLREADQDRCAQLRSGDRVRLVVTQR
ncbi:MAG: biotin-dependent carboxyltransferase family protein [Candidatus Nanopelagicales bacterium]